MQIKITDEELYRSFLKGDDDGLRMLMEKYGNPLTLFINAYIHDIQEAEDLMVEVFAYLVAKKPNIEKFKPHLYKSARNIALRHASKRRKHPHFGFEDMLEEPQSAQLIEVVAQTHERERLLNLCMEKLPSDYREALYLIYFEEMDYVQAAKIMGKTKKQVDNLIQRGKKTLRPLLEKEGIVNAHH